MKPRALIFDVYKTLLAIDAPPPDADARWQALWEKEVGGQCPVDLQGFDAATRQRISEHHAWARSRGVSHAEIFWPDVVLEAFPVLGKLGPEGLDQFLFAHAQLCRTLRLMPGAGELLQRLQTSDCLLGIASNSQPYTLHELDQALSGPGLSRSLFHPELCFWSFAAGFSKPDPHVFRWVSARCRCLGVPREAILMVGDRLDNDMQPARDQGWQTWHLNAPGSWSAGGDWNALRHFLEM